MWHTTLRGVCRVGYMESDFTAPDFQEDPRVLIMRLLDTRPVSAVEEDRDVAISLRLLSTIVSSFLHRPATRR
jgi:hypothetical protein